MPLQLRGQESERREDKKDVDSDEMASQNAGDIDQAVPPQPRIARPTKGLKLCGGAQDGTGP